MNLKTIKLTEIVANPNQPRKHFDEQALQELADSIKSDGLQEPILVRPKGDKYEIVQGERRYRAHKLAELETIQAKVKEVDDEDAFHLAVIENIQREQLTPIEEARAFQKYVEMGYTHEEIAKKVSKTRTYVTTRLRLLNLIPEVQDWISEGKISEGHAKQLLSLKNKLPNKNEKLFKYYQALFIKEYHDTEKISVNEVKGFNERILRYLEVSTEHKLEEHTRGIKKEMQKIEVAKRDIVKSYRQAAEMGTRNKKVLEEHANKIENMSFEEFTEYVMTQIEKSVT